MGTLWMSHHAVGSLDSTNAAQMVQGQGHFMEQWNGPLGETLLLSLNFSDASP